ncbi:MAG: ribulokinase [Tepidisphaeraceae bacterium]|jgi:L-ribulokinase
MARYSIGLDFGTNSVRALLVDARNGKEIASSVCNYAHGDAGIVLDRKDPNLARQHPADYLDGIETTVKAVLTAAKKIRGFAAGQVIGIGVDTTGSTPMPLDAAGEPLAFDKKFAKDPAALAWLWKDHTGYAEAEEITAAAAKLRSNYLAKCGGRYSSEWFWSKILHCARVSPKVFDAAYTWVEIADWIPAVLAGIKAPDQIKRGICAAGHKAMCNPAWGGYADEEFVSSLDPRLGRVRKSLPNKTYTVADVAGTLCAAWAKKLGMREGTPIAVGAFDAHLGGVGSGIVPGALVKIIGTSTCDMMVASMDKELPDIPGLCGIVPESILPGCFGLEAGQSAVGDIFNWFVNIVQPGGPKNGSHEALTKGAESLKPGESGLLALDWHNGNRTILVDQRLTGLVLGLTLHSTPAEIYRALVESTAFGARTIMERFEEYGQKVERVINCGGIAAKSPLVMQIYADVMGRPLMISRCNQTCALGAAIAGAVVAGKEAGGHANFIDAMKAMTGVQKKVFKPIAKNVAVYDRLYKLYRSLHDALGVAGHGTDLSGVMKDLLKIRDEARN